jgi:hypothetical protein
MQNGLLKAVEGTKNSALGKRLPWGPEDGVDMASAAQMLRLRIAYRFQEALQDPEDELYEAAMRMCELYQVALAERMNLEVRF